MRNPNFDILKGLLIILVIIGHFVQGTLHESFLRWLIYGFHMPVFIAIAGYFYSNTYKKRISFIELFSKYKLRLIFPWLMAVGLYWLYLNGKNLNGIILQDSFYNTFTRPYYHLWFVTGLLGWMFTTWLFTKYFRVSLKVLLGASLVISVFFTVLHDNRILYEQFPSIKECVGVILSVLRPQHYVFFIFGLYLRENPLSLSNKILIPSILLGVVGLVIFYYVLNTTLFMIDFFELNIALILFLIKQALKPAWFNSQILQWLGINSFGVYLWHQFPLLFVLQIWGGEECLFNYSMDISFSLLGIGIVYFLSKNRLTNAYLLGMKKNNN